MTPKTGQVQRYLAPSMTDMGDAQPCKIIFFISGSGIVRSPWIGGKKENMVAMISGGRREMGGQASRHGCTLLLQ